MRSREHVDEVWRRYDPRPVEQVVDEVTLSALARFDTPMLVEAADLVMRSAKRLDPAAWLSKTRMGNRLYTDLGGGFDGAAPRRHLPDGYDPFDGDAPVAARRPAAPALDREQGA